MQTLQKDILKNAVLFSLTRRCWQNRAVGNMENVTSEAEKSKLSITKTLIESEELDAIRKYLAEIYDWCLKRALFSCLRPGVYFVNRNLVTEFEKKLADANGHIRRELLPKLAAVYPAKIEAARNALKDQFAEKDYPLVTDLPNRFGVEWSWLELGVPKDLPKEVREREAKKLRAQFDKAQTEILLALRSGFREMVAHAVDRLTVEPGEQPKIFKESLIEKFQEFFQTFQYRNLMEDSELQTLVEQAKRILDNAGNSKRLRGSTTLRNNTAQAFSGVKVALDRLIQEAPKRHIDLE